MLNKLNGVTFKSFAGIGQSFLQRIAEAVAGFEVWELAPVSIIFLVENSGADEETSPNFV